MGPATAAYRLTPLQRRMFIAASRSSMQCVLRIRGTAGPSQIRRALAAVCARHEILRSGFRLHAATGEPLQIVFDEPCIEWNGERRGGSEAAVIGAELLPAADGETRLKLTFSPLVADVATLRLIAAELAAVLEGAPLGAMSRQFADVAAWQNDMFEAGEAAEARTLFAFDADAALSLRLPLESDRVAPFEAAIIRRRLTLAPARDARAFALAAVHALLARLSERDEIVVATRFDGRPYEELRNIVGPLAAVIPIVTNPRREQPFRELVASVQNELVRAHAVEDCFDWDSAGVRVLAEFIELEDVLEDVRTVVEPHQLSFVFQVDAAGLRLDLHFDAASMERREAEFLAEQMDTLLTHALLDPSAAIGDLRLVGDREGEALQSMARGPLVTPPALLREQFEQQAARNGERIAVEHREQSMTYAELDRRANRLAHALHSRGVRRGDLVAISIARSPEMVVALLGVLKAGAAYVPLDLTYPPLRLEQIARDARPKLWLAEVRDQDRLHAHAAETLFVDADSDLIDAQPETPPPVGVSAEDLAYVIYTSGSTGVPKGVAITHGGLANYVSWAAAAYDVAGGSGTVVHSPLGFDLTVTSLLTPLIAGQRAILVEDGFGVEPLAAVLRQRRDLTLVKLTPSHLDALHYALGDAAIDVRLFVVGGEPLTRSTVAWWRARAPHMRIVNEYGPTETVVGCIVHEVGDEKSESVPIGRPIANTLAFVLDERLQLVPFGVEGELCIGGAGVARGYLHRPELNEQCFVTVAHSEPARVYRTGDRARVLADGTFEFRGRVDDQIKVRGHRVELGEIEAILRQHPAVREAAVVSSSFDGGTRLVAYVVPARQAAALPELRGFVAQRLPEVMVPTAIVAIAALPLGAHGKVDRKALAQLDAVSLLPPRSAVSPRTSLEASLCAIWCGVLGLREVGIHDNFFHLGGHSLAATQVVSRIETVFGADVPLRSIFESPTVAALTVALVLRQAELGEPAAVECALEEVERMDDDEVRQLLSAAEEATA